MTIQELIQKYGKQAIKELVDMMIIYDSIKDTDIQPILVKHKIITNRTKIIRVNLWKQQGYYGYNERHEYIKYNGYKYTLSIKNGRGTQIIYIAFFEHQIPEILEALK
jgi:hypothetical protein